MSDSIETFRELFEAHYGYAETDISDVLPVRGIERVALYVDEHAAVTHVARQDPGDGWWYSKMGQIEDIRHRHPSNIEGGPFGTVGAVMKKGLQLPDAKPLGTESLWLPRA